MVFDDDVKLIGLYQRYSEEPEELKAQIIKYIQSETFAAKEITFGKNNELNEVSLQHTHTCRCPAQSTAASTSRSAGA